MYITMCERELLKDGTTWQYGCRRNGVFVCVCVCVSVDEDGRQTVIYTGHNIKNHFTLPVGEGEHTIRTQVGEIVHCLTSCSE